MIAVLQVTPVTPKITLNLISTLTRLAQGNEIAENTLSNTWHESRQL